MVWFSFLIFVVRFQPADKLAAAETEANGDARKPRTRNKNAAPEPLPVPNRQQKRLSGVCTAMNGSKAVSMSAPSRRYPSGMVKNCSELRAGLSQSFGENLNAENFF